MLPSNLQFLCSQNHPTYPSLTLEFLSSYSYDTPSDENMFLTGVAKFRLFNTEYALSHQQLSNMLQFPQGDRVLLRAPTSEEWNANAFNLWQCISGETATNWDDLYASHVHNPAVRYFFRILQHTIFGRSNNHKVNSK